MWLASQKKSYLICDEITNFGIFTQPIPNLFLEYKAETAKQCTEVGRAFLNNFQKISLNKVFIKIKIARKFRFYM